MSWTQYRSTMTDSRGVEITSSATVAPRVDAAMALLSIGGQLGRGTRSRSNSVDMRGIAADFGEGFVQQESCSIVVFENLRSEHLKPKQETSRPNMIGTQIKVRGCVGWHTRYH
jgi:hypothetical protein